MTGVLAACGSSDGGGSNAFGGAGSNPGGSAGSSGSSSLGMSGGGASGAAGTGSAGAAGNASGGSAGNASGGSAGSSGGGGAGNGGRPPSDPEPMGGTIYFCLGDACPHGGPCSGGEVPSCDKLWGKLTPDTMLCEPEKAGSYCLWTDKGQWLIDCAESEGYVRECSGACGTVGGMAHCPMD